MPYNNLHKKITLIQGAGFETDFYQLGLTIAQFPTLFRWSELAQAPATVKASSTARANPSIKAPPVAREGARVSAPDRDDWRQVFVSTDGIFYDSNGVIVDVPDFTASSPPAKQEQKKTKPCRYFQKVSKAGNHASEESKG